MIYNLKIVEETGVEPITIIVISLLLPINPVKDITLPDTICKLLQVADGKYGTKRKMVLKIPQKHKVNTISHTTVCNEYLWKRQESNLKTINNNCSVTTRLKVYGLPFIVCILSQATDETVRLL